MIFDLRGGSLVDTLLAAPAMQDNDVVWTYNEHATLRGLPVHWSKATPDGTVPVRLAAERGEHPTDAWLRQTDRQPTRHHLVATPDARSRYDIVLVPTPQAGHAHWSGWHALTDILMRQHRSVVMLGIGLPPWQWLEAMAAAKVVVAPFGPSTLAADMLGTARVIGLHTPDEPLPYWEDGHCLVADHLDDISVNTVLESIHE